MLPNCSIPLILRSSKSFLLARLSVNFEEGVEFAPRKKNKERFWK